MSRGGNVASWRSAGTRSVSTVTAEPYRSARRGAAGLVLAACLGLTLVADDALGHDIPNEIVIHAFVKPEGERLHFVARVPLILLLNMNLPKRGPGYLDLARIGPALERSAAAIGREIPLFENAERLIFERAATRISQPSDRSFESFAAARAHVLGPSLPADASVFWNQGYFDVYLQYPIRSADADFALDMRLAPGLSGRLKMVVRFMPPGGSIRAYDLHGGFGRLDLDPRWYRAAWTFVKFGFLHILDGIDHLLFLLCLVIPFRLRQLWNLAAIVTAFTVAHSITLVASTLEVVPTGDWFPPLVEMLIALSIVYMASENIVAVSLRRRANLRWRWLVAGGFGLVHGFAFSFALKQDLQFAGAHLLSSLLAFNVGIEAAQLLLLLLALPVLDRVFARPVVQRVGVIMGSAFLAHTGWHWLIERWQALQYLEWPPGAVESGTALVALLLLGAVAWWIQRRRGRRLWQTRAPLPGVEGTSSSYAGKRASFGD
jgi:hydrogenase/urease accessory protein HupE